MADIKHGNRYDLQSQNSALGDSIVQKVWTTYLQPFPIKFRRTERVAIEKLPSARLQSPAEHIQIRCGCKGNCAVIRREGFKQKLIAHFIAMAKVVAPSTQTLGILQFHLAHSVLHHLTQQELLYQDPVKTRNVEEQIHEEKLGDGRRLGLPVIPLPLEIALTMVRRAVFRLRLARRIVLGAIGQSLMLRKRFTILRVRFAKRKRILRRRRRRSRRSRRRRNRRRGRGPGGPVGGWAGGGQ